MNLREIRDRINSIDYQIIDLVSKRISLVPDLTCYKQENNLTPFQAEREKQMHRRYWQIAIEKKINPELVRKIFDLIISESTKLQEEMMQHE